MPGDLSWVSAVWSQRLRPPGHACGQIMVPLPVLPPADLLLSLLLSGNGKTDSETHHAGPIAATCGWVTQAPSAQTPARASPRLGQHLQPGLLGCLLLPGHSSSQLQCSPSGPSHRPQPGRAPVQLIQNTLLAPRPSNRPGPSLSFLSKGPPTAPIVLCEDMLPTPKQNPKMTSLF